MLVGTRELLGEGWVCPPLNVLVDLTVAETGASVQQMRGRTLRLDAATRRRSPPTGRSSAWRPTAPAAASTTRASCASRRSSSRSPRRGGRAGLRTCTPRWGRSRRRRRRASGDRRRPARARRGPRHRARALAGRHALPRRRAADPAGAPRERAPPRQGEAAPHLSQRIPVGTGLGGAAAFGALAVATGAPALLAASRSHPPASRGPPCAAQRKGSCRARCRSRPQRGPGRRGLPRAGRAPAEAAGSLRCEPAPAGSGAAS